MKCCVCGKPERITEVGGVKYSDILAILQACASCINIALTARMEEGVTVKKLGRRHWKWLPRN